MKNSFISWCVFILYAFATLNGFGWFAFGKSFGAGASAIILAVLAFPKFKEACKAIFGKK